MKRTLLLLVTVLTLAAQRGGADAALGAAIHMEEAEGNYKGAVDLYRKFIAKYASNRALAAKAEYRLGLCYEKLGDAEARKAFERVVAKYADQKDLVAMAQTRLNAIRAGATGTLAAVKLLNENAAPVGPVSRDGQWIPWLEDAHGDLMLRNLRTGETRFLTHERGKWSQYVDNAIISPDGKQVLFSFWRKDDHYRSLEIVASDGTGRRVLLSALPEGKDYSPCGWMPDGRTAVFIRRENAKALTAMVGTINTVTGAVTEADQFAVETKWTPILSPDGRSLAVLRQKDLFVYDLSSKSSAQWAKDFPVSNASAWSADSKSVYIGAIDRGPSVIYAAGSRGLPVEIYKGAGPMWLSGVTADGTLIASQFESSLDMFRVTLDPGNPATLSAPSRIKTAVAGENNNPRISPDGKTIVYLRMRGTQVPTLVLQDLASGHEREFVPPQRLSRASWRPDSKAIFVSSRDMATPAGASGMWILKVDSGEFQELDSSFFNGPLHPVLGMYSRDGTELFFRVSEGEKMGIIAYNPATRQTRTIAPLSETFIFMLDDVSPDGKWLLADVRIAAGNVKTLALYPTAGGEPRTILRGEGYFLGLGQFAADGNSVIANGTFRFLGDTKPGLWRFPLSGAAPVKLLQQNSVAGAPSIHPNGREIYFSDGVRRQSLWAIKSAR